MTIMNHIWKCISIATLASLLPSLTTAQSDRICSCAPLAYQWKLDFSQTCDYSTTGNPNGNIGTNIGPDKGVKSATCTVLIENQLVEMTEESLVPVLITGYQLIELGQSLERIKVEAGGDDFIPLVDGGVLTFESTFKEEGGEIPGAFIAFVFAQNANGEEIELQWFTRYSNLCETDLFGNGDSMGWMVFAEESTSALEATCAAASEAPSSSPTASPSASPTIRPTPLPTPAPTTAQPTPVPTKNPSTAPSKAPTLSPTKEPTPGPTTSPTKAPSAAPSTTHPTKNPTPSPTPGPTKIPTKSPTSAPSTTHPTLSPTKSPTSSPTSTHPTPSPTQAPTSSPTTLHPTTSPSISSAPTTTSRPTVEVTESENKNFFGGKSPKASKRPKIIGKTSKSGKAGKKSKKVWEYEKSSKKQKKTHDPWDYE